MKLNEPHKQNIIRNAEFLTRGEACKAVFWSSPGFEKENLRQLVLSRGGLNGPLPVLIKVTHPGQSADGSSSDHRQRKNVTIRQMGEALINKKKKSQFGRRVKLLSTRRKSHNSTDGWSSDQQEEKVTNRQTGEALINKKKSQFDRCVKKLWSIKKKKCKSHFDRWVTKLWSTTRKSDNSTDGWSSDQFKKRKCKSQFDRWVKFWSI